MMNYIYAVVAGLVLVFITLILKKTKKDTADYLLISLNITLGIFILSDVLVNWNLNSFTLLLQNSIPLLIFPLFLFYAFQFTYAQRKIPMRWYGLFIPLGLMLVISIMDHFVLNTYTTEDLTRQFNTPSIIYQMIFKGSQIMFIGVLIYLLRHLKSFHYKLKQNFSSTETIDVKWLANFTRIYLFSLSFSFLLFLGQNFGLIPFSVNEVYGIIYGILILGMIYMTYEGLHHYALSVIPNEKGISGLESKKTSHLSDVEKKSKIKILHIIETKQLYLDPQLSLKNLALAVDESPHYVSKIINGSNRSFYDLINSYRVTHFKSMLLDPKNNNLTILAIGLESGFNSKASLNRIFKKHTGLTPKQFIASQS